MVLGKSSERQTEGEKQQTSVTQWMLKQNLPESELQGGQSRGKGEARHLGWSCAVILGI